MWKCFDKIAEKKLKNVSKGKTEYLSGYFVAVFKPRLGADFMKNRRSDERRGQRK